MKELIRSPLLAVCAVCAAAAAQVEWQARMLEANRLDKEGRYGEAERLYVNILRSVEESNTRGRALAESLNNLGAHHYLCANYAAAEPLFRRALDAWKEAGAGVEQDHAHTLNNLAALLRAEGRYSEAEPLYLQALPLLAPENGGVWMNLAELYRAQGRPDKAETAVGHSLEIFGQEPGPDSVETASALQTLAGVYRDLRRDSE